MSKPMLRYDRPPPHGWAIQGARWLVVAELLRRFNLTSVGVELGVKEGKFSAHLMKQIPTLHMTGVDLCRKLHRQTGPGAETYGSWNWDHILKELRENMRPFGNRWTMKTMDTVDAARLFDDHSLDFVFIDADHTYDGVRRDIIAWRNKIRPSGMICGHDYNIYQDRFAGTVRAVNELVGDVNTEIDAVWWKRL